MKKNTFNICFSADNNYMEQLGVSLVSILKNSLEDEDFNFYVLNSGIDEENRKKIEDLKKIKDFNIEFIQVDAEEFKNCKLLNKTEKNMEHYHVTLPTYFRYKIGSIFKNLSKLLYIDCDIIVRKSLKPLFDTDLKDYYCAMIPDAESKQEAKRLKLDKYFNAGVILINLDLWRKDDLETKLFDYTVKNAKKIYWQDQDVINIICKNKIKELKNEWNFQFFLYGHDNYYELVKQLKTANILHLAGRFKPWTDPFEHPIFEEYYYYLGFTNWAYKIKEYKYECFGRFLEGHIGGNNKYVMSEDEIFQRKLSPVYSAITSSVQSTDEKISSVYSEITNNYEYTNSEIKKTYDYTNTELNNKAEEIKNVINQTTDEKIGNVYKEISNNYDYTNSEIKKTYDYTNSELNNKAEEIKNVINQTTDEKIGNVYGEITRNYDYTNSEIKKTYDYTNTELNNKAEEIKNVINRTTDEKIGNVYGEINKKSEELTSKTENKINEFYNKITDNFDRQQELFSQNIDKKINDLSSVSTTLVENKARETETKINNIYSQITDNLNKNTQLYRAEEEKLKSELYSQFSHFEELSLNNSEEIKMSFNKLLEHLKLNNDKFFELMTEHREKQERELLEKLNNTKNEILSEIVLPNSNEIKQEIKGELEKIKNSEIENIRIIAQNEINNTRALISEAIKQMNSDLNRQQRTQQLDFEKQLLDMEMKFKELNRLLNPLISVVKKFHKGKKPKQMKGLNNERG
ncbi:hypothetical protein IKQ26_02725 [bacterium]|nr:hypothetical protein [bacterium]